MISRSMHFVQILPGRGPFSRIQRKRDAYGAILASQGPVAAATRGTGTRAACDGHDADGAQQARAEERCRNRGAHGSVGPMVSCGAVPAVRRGLGFSRDCRSARAAQWGTGAWTRCRSAGRGGRAVRQACRHRPELCRHDARGHGGALSARCAWSRSRDATGVGRRRGQNYSPKCASIAATRSFSASMIC